MTVSFLLIIAATSCCVREAEFISQTVDHIHHPAQPPQNHQQLTGDFIRRPTACFLSLNEFSISSRRPTFSSWMDPKASIRLRYQTRLLKRQNKRLLISLSMFFSSSVSKMTSHWKLWEFLQNLLRLKSPIFTGVCFTSNTGVTFTSLSEGIRVSF